GPLHPAAEEEDSRMMITPRFAPAARMRGLGIGLLALLLLVLAACDLSSPSVSGPGATTTSGASVASFVTAKGIGNKNVPQNGTTVFSSGDTVYAVAQFTRLPQGTKIFARWSANGTVKEDTSEVTANQDYTNTYVEFHISG